MKLTLKVEDIRVGDRVDLLDGESGFLYISPADFPNIEFEFALVIGVDRETEDCVAIDYEGIDQVGYPVGTELIVWRER
jgi:hypothetical protein